MRLPPLWILAGLIGSIVFIVVRDTTAKSITIIPRATEGDVIELVLTKTQYRKKGNETESKVKTATPVFLTVLKTSPAGLVLAWRYGTTQILEPQGRLDPSTQALLELVQHIRFEIELDTEGNFRWLRNYDEVKKTIDQVTEQVITQVSTNETERVQVRQLLGQMYATREAVEHSVLADALLYLFPFGRSYAVGHSLTYEDLSPSLLTGDPMPVYGTLTLAELDRQADRARIQWQQQFDKEALNATLKGWITPLAQSTGRPLSMHLQLPEVEMEEQAEFIVALSTGWTESVQYSRSVRAPGISEHRTITFAYSGKVSAAVARAPQPLAIEHSYRILLRFIPDAPPYRSWVELNDLTRAVPHLEALRRSPARPGPDADSQAVAAYRDNLLKMGMAEGPYISGFRGSGFRGFDSKEAAKEMAAKMKANAGYDLRHVEQTASAGSQRPGDLQIVVLNRQTHAIQRQLLRNVPELRWIKVKVEEHKGVPILVWGPDFASNLKVGYEPPVLDDLGRGGRLAFFENTMCRAAWTDGVKAMIDAHARDRPSLADVEDIVLLADGLHKLNVFSALLSNDTQHRDVLAGQWETPEQEKAVNALIALKPYQAVATGIGRDKDGFYMGMVLVHQMPMHAQANVERLRTKLAQEDGVMANESPFRSIWKETPFRPWSQVFDMQRLVLSNDGRVLMAKVPFIWGNAMDHPNFFWQTFMDTPNSLLMHE